VQATHPPMNVCATVFMPGYLASFSHTRTPPTYSSTLSRHRARGVITTASHTHMCRGKSSSNTTGSWGKQQQTGHQAAGSRQQATSSGLQAAFPKPTLAITLRGYHAGMTGRHGSHAGREEPRATGTRRGSHRTARGATGRCAATHRMRVPSLPRVQHKAGAQQAQLHALPVRGPQAQDALSRRRRAAGAAARLPRGLLRGVLKAQPHARGDAGLGPGRQRRHHNAVVPGLEVKGRHEAAGRQQHAVQGGQQQPRRHRHVGQWHIGPWVDERTHCGEKPASLGGPPAAHRSWHAGACMGIHTHAARPVKE
jgi:hypothetical protein